MRPIALPAWTGVIISVCLATAEARPPGGGLRLTTFRSDVTPVLDGSYQGGWGQPLARQDSTLWAKGIVLEDAHGRYVLCAIDWCTLWNSAHALFRQKLAEGAQTEVSHVVIQCVHQHTAPSVNRDAQLLLNEQPQPPQFVNLANLDEIADRLAADVRQSLATLRGINRVGVGVAPVDRVASNRRVIDADGGMRVRWSTCGDADLRGAPEGNVDPVLTTITLAADDTPLVRLHYYATHPQSGGSDGWVGGDFVGDARERLEQEEGVLQIYFTGCAGDITVGKYNDGGAAVRGELADRLYGAMRAARESTRLMPLQSLAWHSVGVELPRQPFLESAEQESRRVVSDPAADPRARLQAASRLAYHGRPPRAIALSMLVLGEVRMVYLPGEPMLEFQQFAQRLCPERTVVVAGYGDGDPGYLCTAEAYVQGGYEPTATRVAPEGEAVLKEALERLLHADK